MSPSSPSAGTRPFKTGVSCAVSRPVISYHSFAAEAPSHLWQCSRLHKPTNAMFNGTKKNSPPCSATGYYKAQRLQADLIIPDDVLPVPCSLFRCAIQNQPTLRACPYKPTSIQFSKFPRAHNQIICDSTLISEFVGLVFCSLGNPS